MVEVTIGLGGLSAIAPRSHGFPLSLPPMVLALVTSFLWPGAGFLHVSLLCLLPMRYPCVQQ